MYESYPWPGASPIKCETSLLIKWVKELFEGVIQEIKKEKH